MKAVFILMQHQQENLVVKQMKDGILHGILMMIIDLLLISLQDNHKESISNMAGAKEII